MTEQPTTHVGGYTIPQPIIQAIALGQWHFPVGASHLSARFTEAPTAQAKLYSLELMQKETNEWREAPPEEQEQYGSHEARVGEYRSLNPQNSVLIGDLGFDMPIALDYEKNPTDPSVVYLPSTAPGWIDIAPDVSDFLRFLHQ